MLGPRMPCTPFLCCERALLDEKALEHTEHLKSNYEVIELHVEYFMQDSKSFHGMEGN